MTFFEETSLSRARAFLAHPIDSETYPSDHPVLIAYHGDGDGCTSALFVYRFLKRPAAFYWVATPDFDFEKAENHILEHHPRLVVFLDMPVHNRPGMIQKLTDLGTRVFIYDHHRPGEGMTRGENPNLFCMNPAQNRNAAPYPTCLFGWELLDDKSPFEKQVLYMGLYTETWLERVRLFQDFSPALQESLKETAKRIHGSFLVQGEGTTHHALKFLLRAQAAGTLDQEPDSSEEHRILSNIHDLIQHEKTWLMKLVVASIKKLVEPRYVLLGVESKIRVCGLMASELRWKYPGLVVGVWQKWSDRFICELRRGTASAVDLASLIEGIKNEVPVLTGGGHPEAAAFTAREDSFSQALKAIKTKLTESGQLPPQE